MRHTCKICREVKVQLRTYLTSILDGGELSAPHISCFALWDPLGGPQSQPVCGGEERSLCTFQKPYFIHPAHSVVTLGLLTEQLQIFFLLACTCRINKWHKHSDHMCATWLCCQTHQMFVSALYIAGISEVIRIHSIPVVLVIILFSLTASRGKYQMYKYRIFLKRCSSFNCI
jgi:hypothetical protein